MTGRIFISYRRADSQYATDHIYEKLVAHFGPGSIFMDIDAIPLGVNFRDYIDQQIATSDIVLAVIGDHWLNAVDEKGELRLNNPNDFVRLEIEAALKQGIKLIPIYIGSVQNIPAKKLPKSLADLPMLNATQIRRGNDFYPDVEKLIRGLEQILKEQAERREENVSALTRFRNTAGEIASRLSGIEASLIQEMRRRTQLERDAQRLAEQITEYLKDPGRQLHADVRAMQDQIERLQDNLMELQMQVEARKQGLPVEPAPVEEPAAVKPDFAKPVVSTPKPAARRKIPAGQPSPLRKVPMWAWGAGMGVVLLLVVGVVFGLALLERLSAGQGPVVGPFETSEASETQSDATQAQNDLLEWVMGQSQRSPAYLEDFSVLQASWDYVTPEYSLGEFVQDGVLRIQDSPTERTWYDYPIGDFSDFLLQFEFTAYQFDSESLSVSFRETDEKWYIFEIGNNGGYRLSIDTPTVNSHLEEGTAGPIGTGTHLFQVLAWGDQITIWLDGELIVSESNDEIEEGSVYLSVSSSTPIDAAFDHIQVWDLSEIVYPAMVGSADPPDFYTPVREYLAQTTPTFQEDFETSQPYWDSMQVELDGSLADLSQLVTEEGFIWLVSGEDGESEVIQLNFPDLEAQAFALQYEFGFWLPGSDSSLLSTWIDAFWGPPESRQWFNAYCDLYQQNSQVWCGLNRMNQAGDRNEILNTGLPFFKDFAGEGGQASTLLVIFYQGQAALFLDGYFMGLADGLDFGELFQLSIMFGTDSPEAKYGVAVDNIRFWELDEGALATWNLFHQTQNPVIEYLATTTPTFEEDFQEYQPYWDEMQIEYSDDKPVSLALAVQDGVLDLHATEGVDYGNFVLKFPQLTGRAFALQYDFHFTDPTYTFNTGINRGLTTTIQTYWNDSAQEEGYAPYCDFWSRDQIGCGLYKWDQNGVVDLLTGPMPEIDVFGPNTLLVIFYEGEYFAYLNGQLTGNIEGLDFFDQEIRIIIGSTVDQGKFDGQIDNIRFWNLDGVEIDQ